MKKMLSLLLLCALLVASFSACGTTTTSTGADSAGSSDSSASIAASVTDAEESNSVAEAQEAEASASEETSEVSLPITEDVTTFTLWTGLSPDMSDILTSYDDISVVRELEARTNIHLDATLVSFIEEETQFSLMIASGDYQDIICSAESKYTTGIDGLVNDEICITLEDKLEEYCPNYYALLSADPATMKATMSDSGTMASFYSLYTETLYTSTKSANHWIRNDWLQEQGLALPETYDELYEVLVSFYENYGAVMVISADADEYLPGYGVDYDYMIDDSGNVVYGGITDTYREYLSMISKWYSEGLIYSDYYSESGTSLSDTTLYITDGTGVFEYTSNNLTNLYNVYDGDFDVVPMPEITKNADDIVTIGFEEVRQNGATWCISTNCTDWETLMAYIDYLYTNDAAELYKYGIEDEAYTVNENGEKEFTDLILNNPDGYSQLVSFYLYTMSGMSGFPGLYDYFVSAVGWTDAQWDAFDVWSAKYGENVNQYPDAASMTSDESEEYGGIYSDIETYQEEMLAKFITGDIDVNDDTVWENYVADMNNMNLDRCVEIKQASYERYLAR